VTPSQRAVLIVGAISACVVLFATPRVVVANGTLLRFTDQGTGLAPVVDLRTVGASLAVVVVAVLFLWLALGPGRQGRLEEIGSRLSRVEQSVTEIEAHLTEPEGYRQGDTQGQLPNRPEVPLAHRAENAARAVS